MSAAFSPSQVAEMVQMYDTGMAAGRIATVYGTDTSTVSRRLRAAGVSIRTPSESRVIYRCDADAFERSTDESAYWLGFLLADGCVTAGRRFTLSVALKESDRPHLDNLRTFLQAEAPIKHDPKRKSASLVVSSERLVASLMSRGCGPRKSATLRFPPSGLLHRQHFVRGVFDGDGCISAYRRPYVQPTVSFVGAPPFLAGLRDVICSDVGLTANKLYTAGRSEVAKVLAWTGCGNASRMYRYLYESGGPCLHRKRARFEELGLAG